MAKYRSEQDGQALVEFALVLPILLLILLGILEFGIIFYNKAMVTNASREGARAGITFRTTGEPAVYNPLSEAEILAVVREYLKTRIINFGTSTDVTIDPSPTTGTSPKYGGTGSVNVVVHYNHTFLVLPNFVGLGNSIELTGQTIMRLE
jgi:Flp pilus assembly protein TadG